MRTNNITESRYAHEDISLATGIRRLACTCCYHRIYFRDGTTTFLVTVLQQKFWRNTDITTGIPILQQIRRMQNWNNTKK